MSKRAAYRRARRAAAKEPAEFSVFCPGTLDVLSIGKGDLRLHVSDNPEDRDRARALIEEMLMKGYAIFVETDAGPERVLQFNPKRMTYIIAAGPDPETASAEPEAAPAKQPRKKRAGKREVPVAGSAATAVGRTAGG